MNRCLQTNSVFLVPLMAQTQTTDDHYFYVRSVQIDRFKTSRRAVHIIGLNSVYKTIKHTNQSATRFID